MVQMRTCGSGASRSSSVISRRERTRHHIASWEVEDERIAWYAHCFALRADTDGLRRREWYRGLETPGSSLGGTVTGLTGTGVALQTNGTQVAVGRLDNGFHPAFGG